MNRQQFISYICKRPILWDKSLCSSDSPAIDYLLSLSHEEIDTLLYMPRLEIPMLIFRNIQATMKLNNFGFTFTDSDFGSSYYKLDFLLAGYIRRIKKENWERPKAYFK